MKRNLVSRSSLAVVLAASLLVTIPVVSAHAGDVWEYHVRQYQVPTNRQGAEFLEQSYNELGREGWELVAWERSGLQLVVTFKRKKE